MSSENGSRSVTSNLFSLNFKFENETVFDRADLIVVDSLSQCSSYGDLSHAKTVDLDFVIELGKWLQKPQERPLQWITVADLARLAIEDLQVAKAIYTKLES